MSILKQLMLKEQQDKIESLGKKIKTARTTDILAVLMPNYKPMEGQKRFHDSMAYEKGIKGGYGSGKTTPFIAEAIALSYVNAQIPGLLVYPTNDAARDIGGERLKLLCNQNGLAYEYFSSKGEFYINFGDRTGIIWLAGSDSPDSMKGLDVAFAGLDEPFIQKKEAYEVAISRVRNSASKRLGVFWSGTPEPLKMEWGFEYFKGDKEFNTSSLFTTTLDTRANKHIEKSYIKMLESKYDSKMQEVYLRGRFINLANNTAYSGFNAEKNVSKTSGKIWGTVIVCYDFNVNPMTALVICFEKGVYSVVREFYIENSDTKEITEAICLFLDGFDIGSSVIITGDSSGQNRSTKSLTSDYGIIKEVFTAWGIKYHVKLPKTNPAVRDRVNHVNKLLELGVLRIDSLCLRLIEDLEFVTWKVGADGFSLDKSKANRTHISDALGYGVYNTKVLMEPAGGVAVGFRRGRYD